MEHQLPYPHMVSRERIENKGGREQAAEGGEVSKAVMPDESGGALPA